MSGPADKTAAASVGERLRAARERLGFTLQKVSEDLHLDVPVLEAMEENRFQALGAPVYARGHLKKYATLLGLDVAATLADYESAHSGPVEPTLVPKVTEHEVMKAERPKGEARSGLGGFVVGAIVALTAVGAGAWWYLGPHRHAKVVESQAAPAAVESEAPSPATEAAAPASVESAPAAVSSPNPPPAPTASAVPADGKTARLRLRFNADSWVEVYDAAGARLLFDQRAANTARTVVGVPPFKVLLGNFSGVELSFNGRAIEVPERARIRDTARFRVLPDGTTHASWGAE